VRLTTLIMFGAGYVLGTKAGRERYGQIVAAAEKAAGRLEEYSARHQPGDDDAGVRRARWEEAAR
jgi:hypothetical protein